MAALTVQTITAAGVEPDDPVQITAYSGAGDTITAAQIGSRGVIAEVTNGTGGSLNFQVQDPGRTPAGNALADGFVAIAVPAGETRMVYIGPKNVDPATGTVKVGASTTNSSFTVRCFRY
ncbi:MAG TPA: hypothetical protein VF223_04110 [Trebonia sp.]